MKQKIRFSVFETNSSSTHSISIDDRKIFDTVEDKENYFKKFNNLKIDENNNVIVPNYAFGWGYETYTDAEAKLAYALLDADDDNIRRDMIYDAVRKFTDCNDILFGDSDKGIYYDNYIDHQSRDTCNDFCNDVDEYINFIFNPDIELIIDNDNH